MPREVSRMKHHALYNAKHCQVKALEAKAHPGVAVKVPQSAREFLDTENAFASKAGISDLHGDAGEQSGGVTARVAGAGTKLVVYPSRDGHASYHLPKRCGVVVGVRGLDGCTTIMLDGGIEASCTSSDGSTCVQQVPGECFQRRRCGCARTNRNASKETVASRSLPSRLGPP